MGPAKDPLGQSAPSASRSLPFRNGSKAGSTNLRTLYRISAQEVGDHRPEEHSYHSVSTVLPTSPNLPPTPPRANSETRPPAPEEVTQSSDTAVFRSSLVTPINQNSPPTPDNTPPRERYGTLRRPFLGPQPSIASTHTESFKTAHEDFTSEGESERYTPRQDNGFKWPLSSVDKFGVAAHRLRQSALPRSPLIELYGEGPVVNQSPEPFDQFQVIQSETHEAFGGVPQHQTTVSSGDVKPNGEEIGIHLDPLQVSLSKSVESPHSVRHGIGQHNLKRDKSLRERLLEAQSQDPSASTEKFANIIGWNNSVPTEDESIEDQQADMEDNRRFSGISTTSTVEAYVVEQNSLPRRKTTLRHVSKHESLRSVSSPLPTSNRNSTNSAPGSPHRLVHKKARLSNQHRWSFGSEVSRSYSLALSAVLPKTEVIRVAVIPERSSSLSSTANTSQRQSLSNSSGRSHSRKASENPPSSWQHKRAFSESANRGREQYQAPLIPPRSSSLSAPTSRTTSRANSITSEHVHVRRQQAEKDLRKTLDRMETERLVHSLRDWGSVDGIQYSDRAAGYQIFRRSSGPANPQVSMLPGGLGVPANEGEVVSNPLGLVMPGTKEWAALRPPSIFDTPFSQPSFQSGSPEINEARAINYFPHNNHSVQLIEPFPVAESKAVQEVQKQHLPEIEVDSPLRNPRHPPEPPQFKLTPPTPGEEEVKNQQGIDRTDSVTRPGGSRPRSESLMSSISRNLSLKNARNRKADQDLDGSLHPFWRPRAFWDDIDNPRPVSQPQERSLDRGIVNNSLGLPQERTIITGPVSLVRRISERRRQKRGIVKRPSHSSLAKFRASRKLHKLSGSGLRFPLPLIGIKSIQEKIMHAKQRKEDERRERRRADLRRSIGANVISQGDSRFPASNTSLSRDI
ncbi:uncharacterized protein Z519_12678 [Cladophialophora bantiana CBS 173.52]|uniref:Uncharacterized protein n=1 Tax=Cladophialophora bantiana (strain ATCC 10958 / CBS 173.52 / CDC B-1940 / NIH 8579) TaxID=1442370 RepID=A0A0D2FJ07_CLAB1|nr:uncharacterized protein Z519_12678 [Cladophialophora bantiana CBS 173.52]KIW86692.1 hypothetical protein Z519_12678 [Cladophialophora bantiana CBS 173.52]